MGVRMGIRQVEKLYRKVVCTPRSAREPRIDTGAREEIFHKIMDDLDRLTLKIERCDPGSLQYHALDGEIRSLLLKEVQVIIDDYVIARRNGTLVRWKKMYGDIDQYIADFYRFRNAAGPALPGRAPGRYGLLRDDGI